MAMWGVDISHWNGHIDFSEFVKDNNSDFIIMKATDSISYVDAMVYENMRGARENSVLTGLYHYVRGDVDSAQQARHFIDVVSDVAYSDTLLVLDVEDSSLLFHMKPREIKNFVYSMVGEIYDSLHTYPLIYMSRAYCPGVFSDVGKLCGGWIASWKPISSNNQPTPNARPKRTDLNTTIWQYSDKGNVLGINGNVDLDRAYLTPQSWVRIANPEGRR